MPWCVLAGYLALAVGVFAVLFAAPASDDYAGWSLAIAGLALPAWIVLLRDRGSLGSLGAMALALPASAGLGGVIASLVCFFQRPTLDSILVLALLVPALVLALTIVIWTRIRHRPTRDVVRRLAFVVGAPALVGLLLVALSGGVPKDIQPGGELPFEQAIALAMTLLDLVPLVWAASVGLAWLATKPANEPRR